MKINKITIGRLYNLGNYEHIRYEITVEVPEGESAGQAVRGMEKILAGLKPLERLGLRSKSEIERNIKQIQRMETMPEEDWNREYGHCEGTREEVIQRYKAGVFNDIANRKKAIEISEAARDAFDDLGGIAKHTDAKENWDDVPF